VQYTDIVWTGLASAGGFLLLVGHEKELNKQNWWGVGLIFVAFLFQLYWELATNADVSGIVGVTIIIVIDVLVLVWPGWYRKWLLKRRSLKTHN